MLVSGSARTPRLPPDSPQNISLALSRAVSRRSAPFVAPRLVRAGHQPTKYGVRRVGARWAPVALTDQPATASASMWEPAERRSIDAASAYPAVGRGGSWLSKNDDGEGHWRACGDIRHRVLPSHTRASLSLNLSTQAPPPCAMPSLKESTINASFFPGAGSEKVYVENVAEKARGTMRELGDEVPESAGPSTTASSTTAMDDDRQVSYHFRSNCQQSAPVDSELTKLDSRAGGHRATREWAEDLDPTLRSGGSGRST